MEEKIEISLQDLKHLFDLAVDSPTVCSGSFETDDVNLLRKLAGLIGADPNGITPEEFQSQYVHPFRGPAKPHRASYETDEGYEARLVRYAENVSTCQVRRCWKAPDHSIHQTHQEG